MNKKIILIFSAILVPLLLTGCFGGEDEEGESTSSSIAGSKTYETSSFAIDMPQDWEIVESSQFTSNVPKETVVVFRNNIKSDIFTANLVISRTSFDNEVSSEDYTKSSLENIKNSLLDFVDKSNEEHMVTYGSETLSGQISEYEGRKSATEPLLYFKQLFVVSGETGYMITIGHTPSEDESVVKYLDAMLESFSLK